MLNWIMLLANWILWLLALPAPAAQQGDIVGNVAGLPLSPTPGTKAQLVLRASPALVLAVQKDGTGQEWARLLGADGSLGWTSQHLNAGSPAKITARGMVELSDRSPDQPSFSEGIEAFQVSASDAKISGATAKSRVPSLDKLMIPARLNPFLAPWLEIQAGPRTGWIAPSELQLTWGTGMESTNLTQVMDALGMDGIVRAPFLGPVQTALVKHAPRAGDRVLHFDNILSKPAATMLDASNWHQPELLLRTPRYRALPAEIAIGFRDSAGTALVFVGRGAAVVREGNPIVVAHHSADLDGDGRSELVLQLVSTYGDGYTTALWIVNGRSRENGPNIATVTLGGSGGEPGSSTIDAYWWVDSAAVWVARVESGRVEFAQVAYAGAAGARRKLKAAYAVIAGEFSSREAAEQRAITLEREWQRPVPVFPWSSETKQQHWAVGRFFRTHAAADAFRKQAGLLKQPAHPIELSR
jgi:hypothetical protein